MPINPGRLPSVAAAAKVLAPRVPAKVTANAAAYEFYLRGRDYERAGPVAVAETLYRRALALDSTFALARARLAVVQLAPANRPDEARLQQVVREPAGPADDNPDQVVDRARVGERPRAEAQRRNVREAGVAGISALATRNCMQAPNGGACRFRGLEFGSSGIFRRGLRLRRVCSSVFSAFR